MCRQPQENAFIVVAVYGMDDVSKTVWPTAAKAESHIRELLKQGVPAVNIRMYQTRLVRAPFQST